MESAPRRNRCSIWLHPGVACQKTFEDMVTSRQCTGHRKSPHTRRFRREVQSPFRLLRLSCPGSPSTSLMVTKGRYQAALPRCSVTVLMSERPRLAAVTRDVQFAWPASICKPALPSFVTGGRKLTRFR